jgi:hypothetical protein
VAYGTSLIGPSAEALSSKATIWREHFAPTWVWGAAWLFVAAILCVSAFMRHDALGYATAIGWKIVWGMTTLASWAFGDVARGWLGAVIWFVFAGMIVIISGWPEPHRSPIRMDGNDE